MSIPATQQPSPQLFFSTVNAYQRTEALKAAIELEVFTAIGEGKTASPEIARRCQTSERGMRILCDFLCIMEFLTKTGDQYALTPDSAQFLDQKSPAYFGGAIEFMLSPQLTDGFKNFADMVRKGGTMSPEGGTVAPEHPLWVNFARGMAPMMALPAQLMAKLVDPAADSKLKILDIAAGHGLYGIAFAQKNPLAEVVALDWPKVLVVAKENAEKAGVSDRYSTIEGSAFDTNKDGGRAVTLEFVPNEDRISPPETAGFSVMMLGSTPAGDAYTFSQFDRMFKTAGFAHNEIHELPPTIEQVVISEK